MTAPSANKAKKQPLQHAPMQQFPVAGNSLTVGGRAISDIADEIGGTPFYVYDSGLMTQRAKELREAVS